MIRITNKTKIFWNQRDYKKTERNNASNLTCIDIFKKRPPCIKTWKIQKTKLENKAVTKF